MKIIAINGSPRKNWNTSTLLHKALDGAKSTGAETEMINLYDLNFKGCKSCFACKRQSSKSYGKCSINDDLKAVLEKIEHADAIILGSPIYFGSTSGEMRSFLERFLFQHTNYTNPPSSNFKGKLTIGFVYTMNIKEETFNQNPLKAQLDVINFSIKRIFGNVEVLHSFFTYQTDNYTDMEYTYFDINEKKETNEKVFPIDCQKAFELGKSLMQ